MTDDAPAGDLSNTLVEIEHKGVKYRPRKLTLEEEDEYCAWLERRAVQTAWHGSADLPPEGRDAALRAASENAAAGVFRVGGAGYLRSVGQPAAGAYRIYLGLRGDHPDLTLDDCAEMFWAEVQARWVAMRGADESKRSGGRKGSSGPSKAASRGSRKKGSTRKRR